MSSMQVRRSCHLALAGQKLTDCSLVSVCRQRKIVGFALQLISESCRWTDCPLCLQRCSGDRPVCGLCQKVPSFTQIQFRQYPS